MQNTSWEIFQQLDNPALNSNFSLLFQSQSSLTKALKSLVKHYFAIQLLSQTWMQETEKEEAFFVREVFSVGDGIPWVFGRSVIPKSTYFAEPKIQTLQLKPLGEILFNSNQIRREPFQFAKITSKNREYQQVAKHISMTSPFLWARRSTFWFDQHPLFLTEVFLPELFSKVF